MFRLERQLLDSERAELVKSASEEPLDEIYDHVEDLKLESKNVATSSSGWRVLCNPLLEVSEKTYKGLVEYIKEQLAGGKYRFEDEYGKETTIEEFEDIIEKHMDGYDIYSFEEAFPERKSRFRLNEEIGPDKSRWLKEVFQ